MTETALGSTAVHHTVMIYTAESQLASILNESVQVAQSWETGFTVPEPGGNIWSMQSSGSVDVQRVYSGPTSASAF